jgi:hypothetical protein
VINIEEKIPVRNVLKSGSLNLLEPSGPVQACNRIAFAFTFKTPMKKPLTRLHQTRGKQSMHKLLGIVDFLST